MTTGPEVARHPFTPPYVSIIPKIAREKSNVNTQPDEEIVRDMAESVQAERSRFGRFRAYVNHLKNYRVARGDV